MQSIHPKRSRCVIVFMQVKSGVTSRYGLLCMAHSGVSLIFINGMLMPPQTRLVIAGRTFLRRKAFETTLMLDSAMAPASSNGDSRTPTTGNIAPAATGMSNVIYPKAQSRFCLSCASLPGSTPMAFDNPALVAGPQD